MKMNRDRFNDKYRAVVHSQQELDRKWRCYLLEQEQMDLARRSGIASQNMTGAGPAGEFPTNSIEFVVNTFDDLYFEFDFTSTDEPINYTVDWGDGTIHEDSGFGGYYQETHTYAEVSDYTVRVSFDDPLKILRLNFPGDGYAAIKSISGLQNLTNLTDFRADWNALETVDLSGLTNLVYLDVSDCDFPDSNTSSLRQVKLSGCSSLESLYIDDSDFSVGFPDLSGLDSLNYFDADQSNISGNLDLSFLPSLRGFDLSGNTGLTEVIISNRQPLGGESIYIYNCSLSEESVDNILVALSENGNTGGFVELNGGANAVPSSIGLAAKALLEENGWSVLVNEAPPASAQVPASADFNIVGDFTIEMFVKLYDTNGFPRVYSFGSYPAANAISIENGTLYFWANNDVLINGTFEPNIGQWYHLCIVGEGSTAYMFIDGLQVASSPYSGTISSQGLPLTLGYGNEANSSLNGLMTNFRWTNSAVYNTAGFTVPTSPLTDLPGTVLLIFQGSTINDQVTDNSGNGNNATNNGATYFSDNPFIGVEGSLQVGQQVTRSFMFGISETASSQACGRFQGGDSSVYYLDDMPGTGKIMYTDPVLSTPAPNGWYAYKDIAYQVDASVGGPGEIVAMESCSL